MIQDTINTLRSMKLNDMADNLELQLKLGHEYAPLAFEERLAILVAAEEAGRKNRRMSRLIDAAEYAIPDARIEMLDYTPERKLDKKLIRFLVQGTYITNYQNIVIQGASGTGKTFLACALGVAANDLGSKTLYVRYPDMTARLMAFVDCPDGAMNTYVKPNVLIIDEWLLVPLKAEVALNMYSILEQRDRLKKATIFCSQCQSKEWHGNLFEGKIADGICDRILHRSFSITLEGESLRKRYGHRG